MKNLGLRESRRQFLKTIGAGAAIGVVGFPAIVRSAPRAKSVVVLGIDGMDPRLLTNFIKAGRMPNAKRLIGLGCFSPLGTSNPPQSPVAWSDFISGTNPGGHGIFDFIARDPSTLQPYMSTSRVESDVRNLQFGKWNVPLWGGKLVNLRHGPTFWNTLADNGIDSTILQMPANYPPTETSARTLSGLGTPDIQGSYGIFSFYSDSSSVVTRHVGGGHIERVWVKGNAVRTVLRGPVNPYRRDGSSSAVEFSVHIDPDRPVAKIQIQKEELVLSEGEWSRWARVDFELAGAISSVSGICRFFLKKARDDFQLYVSPVNIDPSDPSTALSTPASYSHRLARDLGLFYTQGMAEDTSALSAGVLSDS